MAQAAGHSAEIEKWLTLIRADGVGPITFAKLLKRFGSVDRALGASVSELAGVDGIGYKTAERIAATCGQFDVQAELALAEKLGVTLISLDDERYPFLLKRIYDPPIVLYVKGSFVRQDTLALSIVGSRRCSLYGQEQASRLAHFLGSAGVSICSGMARGIDTAAHQGALSAGGRTIAVQGCGLATVFPPENKKLFGLISEAGACVSELPLQTGPRAEYFPPRNRIIAGLSLGTIVIEAGYRSGAMITAKAALDYNREVMAVPGKVDSPLNKGAHSLIKQGARLIETVEDVMEALGYVGEQLGEHVTEATARAQAQIQKSVCNLNALKLNPNEDKVYRSLTKEPVHIEHVIGQTDLSVGLINASLISLRLKGLIQQLPGNLFAKR